MFIKPYRLPDPVLSLIHKEGQFELFAESITNGITIADPQGSYAPPEELKACGVFKASFEKDFIFFFFNPIWPDDAHQVLVYDTRARAGCIAALMALHPNRSTYHIQYVQQAKGPWYYWKYN